MEISKLWLVLGFAGQALFSARFIVQWIVSERQRKSVVPIAFWILSLVGGSLLLTYAVLRQDPVIMLGQVTGLFVYIRNLWLIYRDREDHAADAVPAAR